MKAEEKGGSTRFMEEKISTHDYSRKSWSTSTVLGGFHSTLRSFIETRSTTNVRTDGMHDARRVFTEASVGNRTELTTLSRYLILSVRTPFVIIISGRLTMKAT